MKYAICNVVYLFSVVLLGVIPSTAADEFRSREPLPVATIRAETIDVPITYTVPGSVISDGRIEISSRIVGFIRQLDVREGEKVSRGDLLVRIDSSDIDGAITQAKAGVLAAQRDLDDAEKDVQKYYTLTPSGAVATETLRKAKVRVDISQASLDRARSVLVAAEAQKNYASITSPVDGVIVSVSKRSGEMATAGMPLLTVESREVLLFKTFVAESRLGVIDPSTPVEVRIDTLNDAAFQGHIRGIVPSGDDVTRRYEINVILPTDRRLVPGMFGRVDFALGAKATTVVPRATLVRRGGLEGVFVLDGKTARFRWLRMGRILGDHIEVTAGLAAGETILLSATSLVNDGSNVEVIR